MTKQPSNTPVIDPVKLELAKRYLRERGKYVVDPGCAFRPTPSTDRFNILQRYGEKSERKAREL